MMTVLFSTIIKYLIIHHQKNPTSPDLQ
jgi:hypothetical protein